MRSYYLWINAFEIKDFNLEVYATCHQHDKLQSIKTNLEIKSELSYGNNSKLELSMQKDFFLNILINANDPIPVYCPRLNLFWTNETIVTLSFGGIPDHLRDTFLSRFGDKTSNFDGCIQNLIYFDYFGHQAKFCHQI